MTDAPLILQRFRWRHAAVEVIHRDSGDLLKFSGVCRNSTLFVFICGIPQKEHW